MDIAKYVGLFLIKNEYCFLPGIGSLQVVKRKSVYNKESEQLSGPTYDVVFDQRYGSIDDSFANFIANNERISIAHAANHLKDFCAEAKQALKDGNEVVIPAIGKFNSGPNATIQFVTDPSLNIQGRAIPYFKNSTGSTEVKREEPITQIIENTSFREPKGDEEIVLKAPQVNWGKIVMLVAIVLVVIAGAIFLFWYMNNTKEEKAAVTPAVQEQSTQPATDTVTAEQPAEQQPATTTTPAANADGTITYNVALHQYPARETAERRTAKLKSYGNSTVSMIAKDSATYFVAISVSSNAADTTRVVDSLKKLFNPGGKVEILK